MAAEKPRIVPPDDPADVGKRPEFDGTEIVWSTIDASEIASGTVSAARLPEDAPQAINAQTGTTYTLALADAGRLVTCDNASAVTVTVPPNASVAFPVGSTVEVCGIGVGIVTIAQGAGVTVNATPSLVFRARYSACTLRKVGTDSWLAFGDFA